MKTAPSTKPYSAVAAVDGDLSREDGDYDDSGGGGRIIATQSIDLELDQDQSEMRQKERCLRRNILVTLALLAALVFGGREYYVRSRNGHSSLTEDDFTDSNSNGIRGSSNDIVGSYSDLEIAEELFEGANDNGDGMVLDLVEGGEDDYLNGVEEFEGDVDDEVYNGEIGEEFNYEENIVYDEGGEGEDLSFDDEYENTDDVFDEGTLPLDVDGENSEDVEGLDFGEGEDAVSSGKTFETKGNEDISDSLDEDINNVESINSQDDTLAEDETSDIHEEELPEDDESPEEEEIADYFVPLTPDEREQLKEKLRSTLRETKNALLLGDGLINPNPQRSLLLDSDQPKQFMHMHHMKTGGTSLDGLISCALRRQKGLHNGTSINYNKLSECGSRVRTCMNDLAKQLDASVVDNVFYHNDAKGGPQVNEQFSFDPADEALDTSIDDLNVCKTSEANVMSYCASLHAVRTFGWEGVDKITVIRDPVDRAWSMYRFTLNRCYQCKEMKDVLRSVENGTFTRKKEENASQNYAYDPNDSCAVQMIGHQATNLLSSVDLYNVANDVRFPREKEIVDEAVRNLREKFTWIGITDRIQESVDGMRTVFPFLAENLNDAASAIEEVMQKSGEQVDSRLSLPEGYIDNKGCPFEHRNAGRDPTCGTKELDDETISLIKKLNKRDVAVYKAAVERFELQQEVLEEYSVGSL